MPIKPKIKLLLACNSTISRIGLCDLLSRKKEFQVIKETWNLVDTVRCAGELKPDIVLVCFNLLLETQNKIIPRITNAAIISKVVVFNYSFSHELEWSLVQEGVRGIFRADCPENKLVKGLKIVSAGGYSLRKQIKDSLMDYHFGSGKKLAPWSSQVPLTKKQTVILTKVATGLKNCEISKSLGIRETTIKSHLNRIFKKLAFNTRFDATLYAIKYNLIAI